MEDQSILCRIFTVLNVMAISYIGVTKGKITVTDLRLNNSVIYSDMDAEFGPSLEDDGITGRLVYVNPPNACTPVDPPPMNASTNTVWIALIARGGKNCDFSTKVYNVQIEGFAVAIVRNYPDHDDLIPMGGSSQGEKVKIPSVFVGYSTGMALATKYNYTNRNVLVTVQSGMEVPNYGPYLYPFVIVVGTCFCLLVVFIIARWCRDIRSRQRSRLSKKHLKKIPVKKFKKGDYYDVCAICLDEYEEGDKMRVLPCDHAYHVKCIDPWLTKNKKTCPVCKRRVIPGKDQSSDSDDSDDDNRNDPTEATPLLGGGQRPTTSRPSTFDSGPSTLVSGLPQAGTSSATEAQPRRSPSPDSGSVASTEGAVGGDIEEPLEIVVEHVEDVEDPSDAGEGSINRGFTDDFSVNAGQKKELNQVV